jgi:putative ABC transport system permease protein
MIPNYFRMTFRSLWKNKTYSFLNIFGLATGIACAALIFLWVEDEMSYNSNNVNKDRLYEVMMNADVDGGVFTHSSTPGLMAQSMHAEMPGIANAARTIEGTRSALFNIGDKVMYASGIYADSAMFSMFTLPFVQGNPSTAFKELYSIVITEKTSEKFFGDDKNIIGKTVRIDNKQDYIVTGVLKDLPSNSSFQFEWMSPFEVTYAEDPGYVKWTNFGTNTFVQLKPGVDPATIDKDLHDYIQKKQGSAKSTAHAFLFSMNDWRLYNKFDNGKRTGTGRIQYVRLFSTVAWIILFIACINFMNLATARSEKRAREVGVKKTLGAGKGRLVMQFIGEALIMALLASGIAVVIIFLTLEPFNTLVQKELSAGFSEPTHIIGLLLITLVCGLVAGSYPSLYLSSFNPVFALKGMKLKTGGAAFIRKGLVVVQFTISIVLIIGTIIIYQQIQHIKSRDLGYNKDNLIQMKVQGDMLKNYNVIRQELVNTGMIENVALADHETISGGNNTTSFTWPGKDPNSITVISQRLVDEAFMSTTGMKLRDGRDFKKTDAIVLNKENMPADPNASINVIITESLEKLMGKGNAMGKMISNNNVNMKVSGIVKDYVYGDMYGQSAPVVFFYMPEAASLMLIRTKAQNDPQDILARIETVMKRNNPAYPFQYQFVDDRFNAQFQSEMLVSKLSRVFAVLAIIISCLGLFGLAAYTAERRIKEIGIRKVLGASVEGIARLLSKDFLVLVGISCIIAFPLSWWMMYNWLQNYAYRIEISWVVFLIAGVMAIMIALITVSSQAIKAALANPVKSLRSE